MNILDIVLSFFLLWALIRGFLKGILIEVFSLSALVIGVWICLNFAPSFLDLLEPLIGREKWTLYLAYIAIFLLAFGVVYLLGVSAEKVMKLTGLNIFNRLAGGLFGLLKVAFFLSLLLWITANFDLLSPEARNGSFLLGYIEPLAPFLLERIVELFPFLDEVVSKTEEYLERILHDINIDEGQ